MGSGMAGTHVKVGRNNYCFKNIIMGHGHQGLIKKLRRRINFNVKGLVINYGERGATKWENRGSETLCAPPLKTG